MAPAALPKHELFTRLAAGHAARITVVTPNRRLAQVLKAEFDSFQAANKLAAWDDADILPLGAFAQRRYEEALYADEGAALPQLLAPAQERTIWESVLADAPLLSVSQAAAHCVDAWRLAHAWRIAGAAFSEPAKFAVNEDARAYAGWARDYASRCRKEGFIDAARLPDLELKAGAPGLLVAYGFDIVPPQSAEFLERLGSVSCSPETKHGEAQKISFPSARHELEAAARWARARLEAGAKRIGVVVPDLQLRRKEVARVFSDVLRPGWNLPGVQAQAMPFDISIGVALVDFPLVAVALGILELCWSEVPYETASQLIRSPFLGEAEQDFAARARLDAQLRRTAGKSVPLPKLIGLLEEGSSLRRRLAMLFEYKGRISQSSPHDWARHFTALLKAAGFPGERELDSAEYQANAKFNDALGEFSRLNLVAGDIPARKALAQLRRICADTLFQPETPDAPIQVAGILESAGLAFDCLWVSGLTEEAWPLKARPNPFLPLLLQKKAGIPEAAAETSLALDGRITEGWRGAADEVLFSHAEKEKDRDLLPSPLIADVPRGKVEIEEFPSWRNLIFQSRKIETIADGKAPPLESKTVRGGTRVLADQSACPFRAYARHRLGAEGLESPEEGLDALQRGQLLHALMAGIWKQLGSSASLSQDLEPVIEKAAGAAILELKLEGRFAELEKQRLARLARDWLEVERARKPFEVVRIEEKRALEAGGLAFNGRIDRMDRLEDGGHALIDYKTGRATRSSWLGERPDEPQLPLYVVSAPEGVTAVAFATLRAGGMKFSGFSEKEKTIPGVQAAKSWNGLVATWKKDLDNIAGNYAQGDARVDPKNGPATCRNCDLQPLCRVHERMSALDAADDDGESE
jgi:probable DNA repair protein